MRLIKQGRTIIPDFVKRHAGKAVAVLFLLLLFTSFFQPQYTVQADTTLSITPITWNVIGLDSNDVTTGPENFPVGARVCNTGAENATNVETHFVWDTPGADPYLNLRSGSLVEYVGANAVPTLTPGACTDFYYEVAITRNSLAYNYTRRYHITANAGNVVGSVSTPVPREIFVEKLISQNRNSTSNVEYRLTGAPIYTSVPAGGTMALFVGETYDIRLTGSTATNGYEQIETFINFDNTIFKINSVTTTYTANTGSDAWWASKLYGDGCGWVNDPNAPNYRACSGTGKYGGVVTTTYEVEIISGGGTSQTLSNLIYDFSGSSYHYNSDYSVGARIAAIIDPASATIEKAFTPPTTYPGGTSTLTFTLANPNDAALTEVNFTDTFPNTGGGAPGDMVVATPATYSTSGCGTPTFAPTAGAGSISFSDGTIAADSTCTVSVVVTVPAVGAYNNVSDHLFIGTTDTGDDASATLTVTTEPTAPTCTPNLELARWTMETSQGTGLPPAPSFVSSLVSSAAASFNTTLPPPTGNSIYTGPIMGTQPLNYWEGIGWLFSGTVDPATDTSFQFTVDTSNFTDVHISLQAYPDTGWANPNNNEMYIFSSANGGAYAQAY
jgi:hypothetical protein